MTTAEFSNQFDVLYNNITSNQAAGLNEYEKSVFLTKAQDELVKNYFDKDSKGNNTQKGFDDNAIRQMDYKNLLRSVEKEADGTPIIDPRALVYKLPDDVFVIINEQIFLYNYTYLNVQLIYDSSTGKWETDSSVPIMHTRAVPKDTKVYSSLDDAINDDDATSSGYVKPVTGATRKVIVREQSTVNGMRQVVPIAYTEYMRLMSKPFKEPLKYQAWRLISNTDSANTNIEIVITSADKNAYDIEKYVVRYVKRPVPIILTNLSDAFGENLSIHGVSKVSECELDPSVHEAILQRAVELAKIAWEGDVNQEQLHMTAGQRSE